MSETVPLRSSLVLRRKFVASCLCLAFGFTFTTAYAQSSSDRATARNLAAEGNKALDARDFTTAEDRFRRADALVHAPTLVVDHAKALIGLHKYVEAQERLELVIREGVSDSALWVWKKALKEARQLVEEVKPKLGWVTINIPKVADPDVTIDGVHVPSAALGVRRVANPGTHKLEAAAPGFRKLELELAVEEGAEREVTINLEPAPSIPKGDGATQRKPAVAVNTTKDTGATNSGTRALGYTALAVGGAGLIAGTVTGILFLNKQSELQSKCPNGDCQGRVPQSFIDQRNTYGIISPLCIGLGLASGVTGVLLLIHNGPETKRSERSSLTLVPYFALDRIGVEGTL